MKEFCLSRVEHGFHEIPEISGENSKFSQISSYSAHNALNPNEIERTLAWRPSNVANGYMCEKCDMQLCESGFSKQPERPL